MKKAICNILACAVALLGGEVVADVSYDWMTYAVSTPSNIAGVTPGIVLSWGGGATVKTSAGTTTTYNDDIFTIYRGSEIIGTVVNVTTFHDPDVIAGEYYPYKIHGEVSWLASATSDARSLRDVSARSEIYNKIKKVVRVSGVLSIRNMI